MKVFLSITILLISFVFIQAQETESELDKLPKGESFKKLLEEINKNKEPLSGQFDFSDDLDGCGTPMAENGGWETVEGVVTKIINGSSFILQTNSAETKQVTVFAVNTSKNELAAKKSLQDLILNREVEVVVGLNENKKKSLIGRVLVKTPEIIEINIYFLEEGIANFEEMEWRSPSELCRHKKLEEKAKEAKLGIWAK